MQGFSSYILKFSISTKLRQVYTAHQIFINSSNAEKMFSKLSTASHVAKELAQKLKVYFKLVGFDIEIVIYF